MAHALREYQRQVLERARAENVVMVGETGIGKTFVAICLLSELDYSGGRRAFFLAPTRQLVLQIAAKIQQMSTLRTAAYCGQALDLWDRRKWQHELLLTRVLVCTPGILRNLLEKGYVQMHEINLLVFDECHHVTKRHPYAHIMKMYDVAEKQRQEDDRRLLLPRIFGATSCPTKHCARNLKSELVKVELDAQQTVAFAAAAPMLFETYEAPAVAEEEEEDAEERPSLPSALDNPALFESLMKEFEDVKALQVHEKLVLKGRSESARDPEFRQQQTRKFVQACVAIYKNLGLWCFYKYVELEIERLARGASLLFCIPGSMHGLDKDAIRTMMMLSMKRSQCAFACSPKVRKAEELVRTRLCDPVDEVLAETYTTASSSSSKHQSDSESESDDEEEEEEEEESEQPVSLLGIQGPPPSNPRALQGIVFVNTRSECRVLMEYFYEKFTAADEDEEEGSEEEEERADSAAGGDTERIVVACLLGQASRSDTASYNLPKLKAILSEFESGLVRLLVTTSVSAEGIDFPQCGLVLVMDRVPSARLLIQLKGRARHEDGIVYYLAEEGDLDHEVHYRQLLAESQDIHRLDFSGEKEESIFQQPHAVAAEKLQGLQYYPDESRLVVERTGAQLDLDSSIVCLNMFCQSLPAKLYTVDLKNMYSYTQGSDIRMPVFHAMVQLPPELEMDPFTSEPMRSKAMARASAAFMACKELLAQGMLDDSLNSVFRKGKAQASASASDLSYFLRRLHT